MVRLSFPYPNNWEIISGSPKLHQDQVTGPSIQKEGDGSPSHCNDYLGLPVRDDSGWIKGARAPSDPWSGLEDQLQSNQGVMSLCPEWRKGTINSPASLLMALWTWPWWLVGDRAGPHNKVVILLTTFDTGAWWLLTLSRPESLVEAGAELVVLPLPA